jgi:hypothetical protein
LFFSISQIKKKNCKCWTIVNAAWNLKSSNFQPNPVSFCRAIIFRWRSNQVTAVRAANARWHPTAIICTRDGAAPTWSLFAMFQKKIIVVVGWPQLAIAATRSRWLVLTCSVGPGLQSRLTLPCDLVIDIQSLRVNTLSPEGISIGAHWIVNKCFSLWKN